MCVRAQSLHHMICHRTPMKTHSQFANSLFKRRYNTLHIIIPSFPGHRYQKKKNRWQRSSWLGRCRGEGASGVGRGCGGCRGCIQLLGNALVPSPTAWCHHHFSEKWQSSLDNSGIECTFRCSILDHGFGKARIRNGHPMESLLDSNPYEIPR